jgi:acetyl-CoA C-acetyltransferase
MLAESSRRERGEASVIDDRTPVLVGAAQYTQRAEGVSDALDPLALLELVCRGAADDTTAGARALAAVDALLLIPVANWDAANPLDLLCRALGIEPPRPLLVGSGGETGVANANRAAEWIAAGEIRGALVAGCHLWKTLERARKDGVDVTWPSGGVGQPATLGKPKAGWSDLELRHGLDRPIVGYPLFENARRAARGWSIDEHARHIGELMTDFTEVAAKNPYAWYPTARSADELITVAPNNRMVGFPYTKYLNAVITTDQAAAYVMMSAGTARELGIPPERWVFWWGGHAANETAWFVSERPRYTECPAMQESHTTALANAGVGLDHVDIYDFYSCFPIAVEMALDMLGLDERDERGFTITGGLPYAGGPASAYTLHSIAAMLERVREAPESIAMITGNGFYLTKHAASVWSGQPKPSEPLGSPPAAGTNLERDAVPVDEAPSGEGRVEAYTVLHDAQSEPMLGIVVGRTAAGARFLANLPDNADVLRSFTTSEGVGRTGSLSSRDGLNRFDPH